MDTIDRRMKYSSNSKSKRVKTSKILDINFDLSSLNLMCAYIISENKSIRRCNLINMRNLFEMLNEEIYRKDEERFKRFEFIQRGLEARLSKNLKDKNLIKKHIDGGIMETSLIDYNSLIELTNDEIEWINGTVSSSLKYAFINNDIDELTDLCLKFQSANYISKEKIALQIEQKIAVMQSKFRRAKIEKAQESIFALRPDVFEDSVRDYYDQLVNPANKIVTGMQGMNQMTSGGYECGRVYLYLGLQGDGKSWTLLNIAKQIKKYNSNIKTKDPTKKPCVVLLTMENTNRESVERLFSMISNDGKMSDYSIEQVLKIFKEDGGLTVTDDSPVDIILKYVPNRSVDTSYLYTLTDDLEDEGYEVIAFIQDYIMRIRAQDNISEMRLELGAIMDEFKIFAAIKDIPVITASQLNRDAATKIDEARKVNKADLVRLLGRSNTSESMLMINNADFVGILAVEYDQNGNKWLGTQVVKSRFKMLRQYCYLSFIGQTMALVEDVGMPVPTFKETLREEVKQPNVRYSSYQHEIRDINDIRLDSDVSTHNAFNEFSLSGSMSSSKMVSTTNEQPVKLNLPINKKLPIVSEEDGTVMYSRPMTIVNTVA